MWFRIVRVLLVFLCLLYRPSSLHAFLPAGDPPVRADVFPVGYTPEGALEVGVHLQMDRGWHVYWENPGDAGMPVSIEWDLPDGYTAGPLEFPAPETFMSGGMTGFGYDSEVVLFSTIVAATADGRTEQFPEEVFPFEADVSWLACAESCIPGSARVRLQAGTPRDELLQKAATWKSLLPVEPSADALQLDRAVLEQVKDCMQVRLEFSGAEASGIEAFYPSPSLSGLDLGGLAAGPKHVVLPLTSADAPSAVSGVVITAGGAYEVESAIQLPASGPSGSWWSGVVPFLAMLGFSFVGGMLLNVMPCVLPVLGLKVFSLIGSPGEHGGQSGGKGRMLSLVFAAGVLFSFWVLALGVLVLKGMGEQIGWGFQFQSPVFITAIAVIVFAFSLNLFGVFEFDTPVISGKLGSLASHRGSIGAFVSGVLATTLATPCTAPFLGTALGFAFAQPPAVILLFFTVIAVGMALPYVVLAWHPAWLKFLPRPGKWMYVFKQVMGFILIAVVVWLASILASHGGSVLMLNLLILLFIIAVVLWIDGLLTGPGTPLRKQVLVWGISLAIVLFAFQQLGTAPAEQEPAGAVPSAGQRDVNGVMWLDYSPDLIERATAERQTLFIDFTADWCLTCKVMEASVLSNERVGRLLQSPSISAVRADWTTRNDNITALLQRFGRSGVPLFVIVPGGDIDQAVVLPEVITVDMLVTALEQVL